MPTSANTLSSADNKQGIQVIARCAAILRTLSKHPKGLSLAAIAEQVDLPRSTVQRIVNALQDEYFVELMGPGGGFRLGPAIGPAAFEVGPEVRSAFLEGADVDLKPATEACFRPSPGRSGHHLADLYGLARLRLAALGLEAVYGGGLCTLSDTTRFFSYRRDGQTGRMASLVLIDPSLA